MNHEKEPLHDANNLIEIVHRYKQMLRNDINCFFDVHEFEYIIDYFAQHNDLNNARKASEIGIKQHPCSTSLKLKKAQVLIDKGDAIHAITIINELELIETDNYEIYLAKGLALNMLSKHNEAAKYFNLAIHHNTDCQSDLYYSIALSYENVNEFNTAIEYLEKAIELDSRNLSVLYELAYCFDRLDYYTDCIYYYNQYLDIDPFSEVVWFNLGGVFIRLEEYMKAIDAYDFATALNDNYALAYFNKANAYANFGNFEKAIDVYNEYLFFEENNLEALCYIGECYERIGNLDKATELYQKVLKFDSEYSDALYGLGIVNSMNNNFTESINYIHKAISIKPDNAEYWYSIGNIYVKINDTSKAIEAYNKAIEFDPYDYESWLNLSEIFYNKNLLSKAIKVLEEPYENISDVAIVNYRLASYYMLRNDINRGVEFLRKGINKNYEEVKEFFKYCPDAIETKEIVELLNLYKKLNHEH
jgi:tetratricopeptide (TPR) repeat protein